MTNSKEVKSNSAHAIKLRAKIRKALRDSTDKEGQFCITTRREREENYVDAVAKKQLPQLTVVQLKRLIIKIREEIRSRPKKAIGRSPKDPELVKAEKKVAGTIYKFLTTQIGLNSDEANLLTGAPFGVTGKTARYRMIPKNPKK